VLSSISSSSRSTPSRMVWVGALGIAAMFVAAMEVRLLARGYPTTTVDSELLWLKQRGRASQLGKDTLILVGASRMQCDIDIDALRERTKLEPVQLAIDGNSFVPILEGLAADPDIRGTVIVDFADAPIADPSHIAADSGPRSTAAAYEADFEHRRYSNVLKYETSEALLTDAVRSHLRSYAGGARPISSLTQRILSPAAKPNYAVILPDRSRLADYHLLRMPDAYYARVARTLEQDIDIEGMTYAEAEADLRSRIEALTPRTNDAYRQRISSIVAMPASIEARGGHVFFVVFPTSGFITATYERRFPRQQFWDLFAAATHSPTLHFADVPALQNFTLPDGSHLDYRDRGAFTLALADALGLRTGAPVR